MLAENRGYGFLSFVMNYRDSYSDASLMTLVLWMIWYGFLGSLVPCFILLKRKAAFYSIVIYPGVALIKIAISVGGSAEHKSRA
jgi:hypothetical protein